MKGKKNNGKKNQSEKLNECLSGISYPANKDQLITHAKNTCGDEAIISMLKDLPEQSYGGVSELTKILPSVKLDVNL